MQAIRTERQRRGPQRLGRIERPVEVRKVDTVAGGFPLQRRTEGFSIAADQQKVGLPGAMLGRRPGDQGTGGKMDETVAPVVG